MCDLTCADVHNQYSTVLLLLYHVQCTTFTVSRGVLLFVFKHFIELILCIRVVEYSEYMYIMYY